MLTAKEGQELVTILEDLLDVARKGDVTKIVFVVERKNDFLVKRIGQPSPGFVGALGAMHIECAQSFIESLTEKHVK